MPYFIVCRTESGPLIPIVKGDEDEDVIAEFQNFEEAADAAQNTTACRAWPYEIIEAHI